MRIRRRFKAKDDTYFCPEATLDAIVALAQHKDSPTCVRHAAAELLVQIAFTLNHQLIDDPHAEIVNTDIIRKAFATEGPF